jgi:hypothetical protein
MKITDESESRRPEVVYAILAPHKPSGTAVPLACHRA